MLNFVPYEFIVPEKMETEEYRLRMLSIDDVEKDFEAVISSACLLYTSPSPRDPE